MSQKLDYTLGTKPDGAYETWRDTWTPPLPRPVALPGKAIVEFSPFGTRGTLWTPERASNNAMVVSDGYEGRPSREGFLPCGTEICYTGTEGTFFTYEGRRLCAVPKAEVEMYFPKEDAA